MQNIEMTANTRAAVELVGSSHRSQTALCHAARGITCAYSARLPLTINEIYANLQSYGRSSSSMFDLWKFNFDVGVCMCLCMLLS